MEKSEKYRVYVTYSKYTDTRGGNQMQVAWLRDPRGPLSRNGDLSLGRKPHRVPANALIEIGRGRVDRHSVVLEK